MTTMINHKPITAVCLLHSNGAAYANQRIGIKTLPLYARTGRSVALRARDHMGYTVTEPFF